MTRPAIQVSAESNGLPITTVILSDFALSPMRLDPNVCELWLMSMTFLEQYENELQATLSPEEVQRCERFRQPVDRRRFTLSHGALRRILGCTLESDPAGLQFFTGAAGKPSLVDHPLQFNLSHTSNWVAIACAAQGSVGVDIEEGDRRINALDIATHSFHPNEAARLTTTPAENQLPLFLHWWTAKEALLKAWGKSIFEGIATLDFSSWDSQPMAKLTDDSETQWNAHRFNQNHLHGTLVTGADVQSVTLRLGLAGRPPTSHQ